MQWRASLLMLIVAIPVAAQAPLRWWGLREANPPATPPIGQTTAIVGATLIDGTGAPALADAVVLLGGSRILEAGPRWAVEIPPDAERVDATGQYLLPGLFDAHFHSSHSNGAAFASALLDAGVTSFRDPGHPDSYGHLFETTEPRPRAFLTGKHLDLAPPAYPKNSILLETAQEVVETVDKLLAEGASALKVYFRLPEPLIRVLTERADRHGVPVTAHLELVRADAAIRAGVDGIEHVTSLGTTLATEEDAAEFERGVDNENSFRRDGRYWLWNRLSFDGNPRLRPLLDLMVEHGVYLTPTLYTFEMQDGDKGATAEKVGGFNKMVELTGIAHQAGIPILSCSHGRPPEANWRDIELIAEAGVPPMNVIRGSTDFASRFFGVSERLGTVEAGKLADLILLDEDPLQDISAVRSVKRVMLNGAWVR